MKTGPSCFCVLASTLLYVSLGVSSASAQIEPARSASIKSVTRTPCEPLVPVPAALDGLVEPICSVPKPLDLGMHEVRPPSADRNAAPPTLSGRGFGPSGAKFWFTWAATGGLIVLQVNATTNRARRHGAQQFVPPSADYALNFGVMAAGVAVSYRWSRDEQTHGSGWWLFPAISDVIQVGGIAWARTH
jgi:hypothetical protein